MADLKEVMVIAAGLSFNGVNFIQSYTAILRDLSRLTVLRCDVKDDEIPGKGYKEIFIRVGFPEHLLSKIVTNIAMQFRIARRIFSEKPMDAYIFFLSESLFIPIVFVRLMGRKAVIAPGSSSELVFASRKNPADYLVMYEERMGYSFCTNAILYSERLIDEWGLTQFRDKILVCPRHYVREDLFSVVKDYPGRDAVIGYVGRLSREKGVLNLVQAVPAILKEVPDVSFQLIGDGVLRSEIESFLDSQGLGDRVELCGWADHARLADCLNNYRVLVLPSDTEGLPNIVLEAMACGVVVIASPVGAVPDLISDGESGFLLDSNDASSIADRVVDVLHRGDLAEISKNASAFIDEEYRFGPAQERYRRLLTALTGPP